MKKITLSLLVAISCFADVNSDDFSEFDKNYSKSDTEVFDPLSGYNRVMTDFNDYVYTNILIPTAKGYAYIIPEEARIAIDHFFDNLMYPVRVVNNLLQLKFQNSLEESERFVVNTLWGLGGFMDPATNELKIASHKEDFGQTLGYYGMGEGFSIVLPFLGPSNARDLLGLTADSYVSALNSTGKSDLNYKIPNNLLESVSIKTFDVINETSLNPNQYETIKKDALDLYPFLRDIYTQSRQKQIEE